MGNTLELTTWETTTCSRCGGSGTYSYCQMYGHTCFKCRGAKRLLTPRGAVAFAWLKQQRMTPVAELKVGMRIRVDGYRKPLELLEIKEFDGYVNLGFEPITCGVFPTSFVEVIPSDEAERVAQVKAAIAYQNTLTKTGKPRKVAERKQVA